MTKDITISVYLRDGPGIIDISANCTLNMDGQTGRSFSVSQNTNFVVKSLANESSANACDIDFSCAGTSGYIFSYATLNGANSQYNSDFSVNLGPYYNGGSLAVTIYFKESGGGSSTTDYNSGPVKHYFNGSYNSRYDNTWKADSEQNILPSDYVVSRSGYTEASYTYTMLNGRQGSDTDFSVYISPKNKSTLKIYYDSDESSDSNSGRVVYRLQEAVGSETYVRNSDYDGRWTANNFQCITIGDYAITIPGYKFAYKVSSTIEGSPETISFDQNANLFKREIEPDNGTTVYFYYDIDAPSGWYCNSIQDFGTLSDDIDYYPKGGYGGFYTKPLQIQGLSITPNYNGYLSIKVDSSPANFQTWLSKGLNLSTRGEAINPAAATAKEAVDTTYLSYYTIASETNSKLGCRVEANSKIFGYAAFQSRNDSGYLNINLHYLKDKTLFYYANDGTNKAATVNLQMDSDWGVTSLYLGTNTYFTRNGYTLTGWNTTADGSGTSYNCGQQLTNIRSDLTLYAQWKINKYEVRFCNNTGVRLSTVTCDPGSSITMATATTAPAINVEQLGWSIINNSAYRDWNATLGNGEYACGATYTPTASLTTFYPIWKYKEQYIEFFDIKGNFNNSNTTTNSWNMNTKNSYDLSTYTNYKFSLCYNHHGDSERADYKKWPQFYSLLKDWTLINAPSGNFMTMCYGKDRFVGLGTGQAAFIYSKDGIEWTKKKLSSSCYWNSICYSKEKNFFVGATSFYPSSQIGYSSDGMSWTIQDLDLSYQKEEVGLDSLAAGNNIFLAIVSINSTNDFYYTNQIARSVDGINWELKTLPETASWEKIQFLNNKFILNDSTGKVYYSTDGITWSLCSISNNAWSKFCFGNDIYLGVSSTSQEIAYSSDGITWNIQPSTIGTIDEIMFDGKKFIAVNKTRKKLYYSYLGKQWNEESINFTSSTVGNITLITGNGQLLLTEGYGHDIYRAASKTINYRFTGFSKTRGTLKPEYHSNSTIDLTPYNNKSVIPLYAVWQPYFRFEDKNNNMLIDGYNGRIDNFITTLQMNELFNYFSDYGNYETVIPKTAYLNKKTRITSGQFTTPDSYLVSNNTRMKSTDFYLLQKCYNSLNEDPINKNFTSPLTFTPVNPEDTITIKLKKVGSPTNSVYRWYYSSNAGLFGFLLPNDDSITLSNGNNVCLMPWFSSNLNALSTDSSNYYQFEITGGLVKVSGSVLSLINISEDKQLPDYCFYNLFKDCTNIITAPELPSLKVGVGSYQGMFQGCAGLTIPPSLPATTLGNNCYSNMFQGCTSLKVAPNLPATTLTSNCYSAMFKDCISLKVAPKLPATTLETNSYLYMFFNCSNLEDVPFIGASTLNGTNEFGAMFNHCTNLKHIKLAYTGNFSNSHFGGWVNDVASNGILEYDGEDTAVGVDAIPSGWTVKKST